MFNKGLDSNEKQEGLLKRLRNIEDKSDNQLDFIRDQGNKQLDSIDKINYHMINAIYFHDEGDKELKELNNRVKNISFENLSGREVFHVKISGKGFGVDKYRFPSFFASNLPRGTLSLKEAKNEQNEILNLIDELEKNLLQIKKIQKN